MMEYIKGMLSELESDYLVVESGGIGYRLFCGNPFSYQHLLHQEVKVFVHLYVREDVMMLYGFLTKGERELFRKLLDVSGIGPKGALSVISAAPPEQIISAIQKEDVSFLTKFPGIGKKTAQRIILEMKDKLKNMPFSNGIEPIKTENQYPISSVPLLDEAVEALLALGYTQGEVDRVILHLREEDKAYSSIDEVLKRALKELARG
ncbi:Holliday junction branch migration protein RuvA [Microaerobacter geothermalis]|uniref:Holliday junction branch migration protein RuvA n=1 Tax=Microaerobacter geothermalis TaxID=674972 RepID=UPI001F1D5B44|nr:Holliday junction branch migration protein RuvA [Microaerobacter geothermalis]MCF6092746.1 Holliday junction branch migration protein RuvA [Microaerobacter geothermalis]